MTPIIVEFHGHLADRTSDPPYPGQLDAAIDATQWVQRVRWSHSTQAPWTEIDLELRLPRRLWPSVLPGTPHGPGVRTPGLGWYIILRVPASDGSPGAAVAWGRVTQVAPRITADAQTPKGHRSTLEVSIRAHHPLMALASSRLLMTTREGLLPDGFGYTLASWRQTMTELLRGFEEQSPGIIFERVWQHVASIRLPDTLTPSRPRMGDAIPLVHDRESAARVAPMRSGTTLRVPGRSLTDMMRALPRARVWQWLMMSFAGDERIVEVFPSLEHASALPNPQPDMLEEDGTGFSIFGPPHLRPEMLGAGRTLGAQPVLVYRLRPWLVVALDSALVASVGATGMPLVEQVALESGELTTFGQEPVNAEAIGAPDGVWYDFRANDIVRLSIAWSEDAHVNAARFRIPSMTSSGIDMTGIVEEPAVNAHDVERHGLRMEEIDWPFWPLPPSQLADEGEQVGGALSSRLAALAELSFALLASNDDHHFARLEIEARFRPHLQAGHWIGAELDEDLLPLDSKRKPAASGYMTRVSHEVLVNPRDGTVSARTTLHCERASLLGQRVVQPIALKGAT